MSKYCVSGTCCQNKELNSLSHHSCYLLAPVADYDGSTLMSEMMMMLVMMAIAVTLTTTGVTSSAKTSGGFLKDLYWVVYMTDALRPFLLPHQEEYLTVIDASVRVTFGYETRAIDPGF